MSKKKEENIKEAEIKDLKEKLARALADYDNLRKRTEKERLDMRSIASLGLVLKFLPIYDMLENAQKHLGDQGLAIVINEFVQALKDEGVEKIAVKVGDKFDEQIHEVVEVVTGQGEGIKEVVLSGWKLSEGIVVRPAKVKVVKKDK